MAHDTGSDSLEANRVRQWVVGVDGSESSRQAAHWTAVNVDSRADELHLVSAWNVPTPIAMSPMLTASTFEALEAAANSTLADLSCDLATSTNTPITTSVGQRGAAELLLDAATEARLVVVGRRGHGGFARLLLGSTSTQCATHSPAPVAVIPLTSPSVRPDSIVIAFDGSANALAALRWALEFADRGASVDCMFVWNTAPLAVGSDQFFFPEASDLARERFEHLVSDLTATHPRTDLRLRSVFVEGDPRAALTAASTTCDLLVMGARGHGAIGAAVLGSVSTWLLHHLDKPMVVVPHRPVDERVDDNDSER